MNNNVNALSVGSSLFFLLSCYRIHIGMLNVFLLTRLVMCLFIYRKLEQVAEEADSLKHSLDKYYQRHQRRMQEAQHRAALLARAVCTSLSFCIFMLWNISRVFLYFDSKVFAPYCYRMGNHHMF